LLFAAFVSILFSFFKQQKHNNDDAYLNNKHRKTFFYNLSMFGAAVRREIMKLSLEITIKSRLLGAVSEAVVSQSEAGWNYGERR
jgi:hypothetical protein